MKKYFIFIFISFFVSCANSVENKTMQIMSIYNYSNEAIYVYYNYYDELRLSPKLELFLYLPDRAPDEKELDPYCSPKYRINPHTFSTLEEQFVDNKKWIPFPNKPEINYVNFFFIKEGTMKNYSWEEIVAKQMYEKKVRYTYDELEKMHYKIFYNEDKNPTNRN